MLPPYSTTPTWTDTDVTPTTLVIYVRGSDTTASWGQPTAEEERRRRVQRELAAFLELLYERRERLVELTRTLSLSRRRPRPRTTREPEQRPKARSTSGSERWRVRNPNA